MEPEDSELGDCLWGDDLGLVALDGEANRLLRLEEMEEPAAVHRLWYLSI